MTPEEKRIAQLERDIVVVRRRKEFLDEQAKERLLSRIELYELEDLKLALRAKFRDLGRMGPLGVAKATTLGPP